MSVIHSPQYTDVAGEYHGKYGAYSIEKRMNHAGFGEEILVSFEGHHAAAEIEHHHKDLIRNALNEAVGLLEERVEMARRRDIEYQRAILGSPSIGAHNHSMAVGVSGRREGKSASMINAEMEMRYHQQHAEMEMRRREIEHQITSPIFEKMKREFLRGPSSEMTMREKLQFETDERLGSVEL